MKIRALKELRFKTSRGEIFIKHGQVFKPSDPSDASELIKGGFVEPVILPPDQVGRPYAAKIYSKILDDTVWVLTHPSAISFIPEGACVYLPEEIRNLRGVIPEEISAIHRVKKELGGKLIAVNQRGEG